MNKMILPIVFLALAVLTAACTTMDYKPPIKNEITNFLECEAEGGNIAESYPRQCMIYGETFVEEFENVISPYPMICEQYNGTWIAETGECEGIGKKSCEELGGYFNDCASACRNDPNVEICTMQCVLVCDVSADRPFAETHVCTDEEKANMMCTREYMPVCGNDGKTYGNDCTACASENVTSWTEGEC